MPGDVDVVLRELSAMCENTINVRFVVQVLDDLRKEVAALRRDNERLAASCFASRDARIAAEAEVARLKTVYGEPL